MKISKKITFGQFLRFGGSVCPAHDKPIGVIVMLEQFSQNSECLHRQLASRGEDDDPRAVAWHELQLVDQFDCRYEERQGFSGSSFCGSNQISTLE